MTSRVSSIDPPRDVGANADAEDLVLDLVDVVLHAGHHGGVVVDDAVHDRVQDRHRAAAQQVGARLQAAADGGQIGRLAVADRDHELWAGEDVHLAELDGLRLIDVAGRVQNAEQRLAVVLELGALVRVYGVLDGELVQPELARDVGELLVRRAVKPDPGDPAANATGRGHLREILRLQDPLAVTVDGTTDNHARKPILGLDGALPATSAPTVRRAPRATAHSSPCSDRESHAVRRRR